MPFLHTKISFGTLAERANNGFSKKKEENMHKRTWLQRVGMTALLALGVALDAVSSASAQTFAKGADASWVTQQESAGYGFYTGNGAKTDPFYLLKAHQHVDSIRLRVWVNPSDGWSSGADVLAKAQRAKAQGQRIMIDFHYSDSWADPGKQNKPAAWASHTIDQLVHDVSSHTTGILNYLKQNGIDVTWVQVGNEINGGMLWPEGATSNFANLVRLINTGYDATKSVYPNAKVIVHLANGYKNAEFRTFFDKMTTYGGKWDITGMSHYPPASDWQNYNNLVSNNMWDMAGRYSKPVAICEVGMDWQQAQTSYNMLVDLINKTRALGTNGAGVFYWEPQAYPGWQGYTMGAMDSTGKFTSAMDAFL
jgi:arabinogalactan endo-1,4-beta-galactosidase